MRAFFFQGCIIYTRESPEQLCVALIHIIIVYSIPTYLLQRFYGHSNGEACLLVEKFAT